MAQERSARPLAVARYVGPALLCLVALTQIYWASARGLLTPARGGGFGLFSTVDKLADRQLRMFWVGPSGIAQVALPGDPAILRWTRSVTALPTEANLRATLELMDQRGRAVKVEGEPPFPAARVEVWKRAFDQDTQTASRVLVAALRAERGP